MMFRKTSFAVLAAATALTALPAAADARPYSRNNGYAYSQNYYSPSYYGGGDRYRPNDYYYGGSRNYYGRNYSRGRCSDGTAGTIIGAIAGGLLGREIDRGGGSRYNRYHRGSGTTGLIVGGAAGALVGRSIDRNC